MAETENYKLFICDENDEATTTWRQWCRKIAGATDSNMIKIDQALANSRLTRDTDEHLTESNPILADGERIIVQMSDGSTRLKIGDGKSDYKSLSYFVDKDYIDEKDTIPDHTSNKPISFAITGVDGDNFVVEISNGDSDRTIVDSFNDRYGAVYPQKGDYSADDVGAISIEEKGAVNGVAELDENGKVPLSQLPTTISDGPADSISPTITIEPEENGYAITFTDKDGSETIHLSNGVNGSSGSNGKSAFQSAQDGGFVGTENEFNAALACVNEKQEKLYGSSGQIVGFDSTGNAYAQDNQAIILKKTDNGVYSLLDVNGNDVSSEVLRLIGGIPNTEKGSANGVASLDESGKVVVEQIPDMNYVQNTEKGANNGIATLGDDGKIPSEQIPSLSYDTSGAASNVQSNLNAHAENNNIHVTADEKNIWNSKSSSGHTHESITGTLGVDHGGTGVTTLIGTDYATSRVRAIQAGTTEPNSLSNGTIYLLYE